MLVCSRKRSPNLFLHPFIRRNPCYLFRKFYSSLSNGPNWWRKYKCFFPWMNIESNCRFLPLYAWFRWRIVVSICIRTAWDGMEDCLSNYTITVIKSVTTSSTHIMEAKNMSLSRYVFSDTNASPVTRTNDVHNIYMFMCLSSVSFFSSHLSTIWNGHTAQGT